MSTASARVVELKKRYEENPRRFFAPLANEYRKAGDLDAAIDLCRTHLEEQPGHLSGHIVYGQALYEAGRPADAKAAFDAALTLDPENLIALRHLGDIAASDRDAAAATHWYQRVLDADPRNDEVIALIAGLQQFTPASTVVVVDEPPPPPAPQYAVESPAAVEPEPVSHDALTPVIPIPAVSAAPRGSIGLMDLNLDLGEETVPSTDLLGGIPDLADSTPPAVDEPAPVFEAGFPIADSALTPATFEAGPELLGVEDANLGLAAPDLPSVEVFDASFDVDAPVIEDSTFGVSAVEPTFGDGLEITTDLSDVIVPSTEPASPVEGLPMLDMSDDLPVFVPVDVPVDFPVDDLVGETTAAPSAGAAEPAAPTASDFDSLFGASPLGDVFVGGTSEPVEAGDAGFMSEALIGREPLEGSLDAPSDVGPTPPPFVTETMAELYLQQGFRDEALDVYRQLLAQNPEDAGLAARVRHLELGSRSSLAIDSVSDEIEAIALAEERRLTGDIPVVPAPAEVEGVPAAVNEPEMVIEPATVIAEPATVIAPEVAVAPEVAAEPEVAITPEAIAEPSFSLLDTTPAFLVQAPEPVAPLAPPVPVGPSAREVLARIAYRRAVPGGRVSMAPIIEAETVPAPIPAFDPAWAPADEANLPVFEASAETAPGGSIDHIFAPGGVNTGDEGAAAAVAAAFGAPPADPVQGQPTYAGTDELSLDSVFHGDGGASRPAPAVQRQSTKLRFDQFFAGADDAPSPTGALGSTGAPPLPAPGQGDEDIAQFNVWLKGLKGQ